MQEKGSKAYQEKALKYYPFPRVYWKKNLQALHFAHSLQHPAAM